MGAAASTKWWPRPGKQRLSLDEWMPVLQGQRAGRVDGLLTVLDNCSPLSQSKAKAPGDLEDGGTDCQTFKNLKQKNLSGISLQVRSREDQRARSRGAPALLLVCSDSFCTACQQQVPSHSTVQRPSSDTGNLLPSCPSCLPQRGPDTESR